MIQIENFDVTRMGVVMNRYVTEFGFGAKEVTERQAGLLQGDLVKAMGPKNLGKAQRIASKDVSSVFATDYKIPNIKGSHRQGAEFVWLAAGPKWLVGVEREKFKPQATAPELKSIYRNNSGRKLGKKYWKLERRGQQQVEKINRFIVGRGKLAQFIKAKRDSFGKLKASWAFGWFQLRRFSAPRPPNWIWKHVTNRTSNGSVVVDLKSVSPSVTLISRATGAESEHSQRAIKGAISRRVHSMKTDLQLYARGIKKRET